MRPVCERKVSPSRKRMQTQREKWVGTKSCGAVGCRSKVRPWNDGGGMD